MRSTEEPGFPRPTGRQGPVRTRPYSGRQPRIGYDTDLSLRLLAPKDQPEDSVALARRADGRRAPFEPKHAGMVPFLANPAPPMADATECQHVLKALGSPEGRASRSKSGRRVCSSSCLNGQLILWVGPGEGRSPAGCGHMTGLDRPGLNCS